MSNNEIIDDLNCAVDVYIDCATEGYGFDTLRAFKGSQEYKDLVAYSKSIKQDIKLAKKSNDPKFISEVIEKVRTARGMMGNLKKIISSLPDPDSKLENIISAFTPVFSRFNAQEVTGVYAIGTTMITTTKTYEDEESKYGKSFLKKDFHRRANLFIKQMTEIIEELQYKKDHFSK